MVKGRAKSVSFGVVLKHPEAKENSIISETSSVDITDGSKMSSLKRKSIIKLPYKNPEKDNEASDKKDGKMAEQTKKPAKVFQAHKKSHCVITSKNCLIYFLICNNDLLYFFNFFLESL